LDTVEVSAPIIAVSSQTQKGFSDSFSTMSNRLGCARAFKITARPLILRFSDSVMTFAPLSLFGYFAKSKQLRQEGIRMRLHLDKRVILGYIAK
jgi:hypothetical protein